MQGPLRFPWKLTKKSPSLQKPRAGGRPKSGLCPSFARILWRKIRVSRTVAQRTFEAVAVAGSVAYRRAVALISRYVSTGSTETLVLQAKIWAKQSELRRFLFQPSLQRLLGQPADFHVDLLAILEQDQGRNAANAELSRRVRRFIDV